MSSYFGTDGIRGKVGVAPITADFFLKLGWAVGSVLAKKGKSSVVIGKDTRVSGYIFESALEAGFLSAGVDVGLLGPMPTPGIAYLTKKYNANAGVVISASHNSFEDNGVKFFSLEGFKLSDTDQKEIEEKLERPMVSVDSSSLGKAKRWEHPISQYVKFCKESFDYSVNLGGLDIVIDCANGATYHLAEDVFSGLGANISMINNKPDGFNINLKCGATDTANLRDVVLKKKADLGIAFDGDGDRLIMIDANGELVDGDELVFILAKFWHSQNHLLSNAVVGTKMSNLGMRHALRDLDINFIEADVGDRFVMEQMQSNNAILGGEGSGHIICLDKATSGDAMIAALQVLEVIAKRGKTLSELKSEMQKYPQVLINVKTEEKIDLEQHTALKQAQAEVEKNLGDEGRVLIRASGTEPLIRVMVEGKDLDLVQQSAEQLADVLR
ncbi:MAG: phosphoglucosamine mutase [Gammaproteobacteria bacterium]|nr:MAG: phosphoglucosamine mutase [Gammaproteobacteria bacterium]